MPTNATTATRWDRLHRDPRHQLTYPSEHAVRFLTHLPTQPGWTGIDIGCGTGKRHMNLMDTIGINTFGIDASAEVKGHNIVHADMRHIPFKDNTFHVAIAYGVFYYATMGEADNAAQEMFRILRPGGHALIVVRTDRDWRTNHINHHNLFDHPDEPEHGMTLDFINEDELRDIYGRHASLRYELAEWTTHDRARLNSDWIIEVTK